MKVEFGDAAAAPAVRLTARIVDQDALPADLDPVVAGGARTARFSGKTSQIFEMFAAGDSGRGA
jgi:leucyl aminopeptidase